MEIADDSVIVNSSRLKSVVWNDFDRVRKGDTFIAICRHCNRKLSGSSTSGTSHLRNHLIRCRRRSNQDISQLLTRGKRKETTFAVANFSFDQEHRNDEAVSIVRTKLDQNCVKDGIEGGSFNFDNRRSRLDLARMIILHGYPLAMVEHTGFRIFARDLQPLFDIPTFDGVEADCREIYLKERQKVYEELDKLPGICLSADTWTANGDAEYLCLTAHYIDDSWQLKKKILNFLMIDPSQTEDVLSEIIMTSLRNWDIDRKLFSMTFDNYSIYDKIVSRIREQLCQHRFLLCDGQLFDIRCAANLIKLMVQDTLEKSCEILSKVRESVQYVQRSQATQEKFNEMVQLAGINSQKVLRLDNKHQWSSTYIMLEAALEYKDAFPLLQEHDPQYGVCPSIAEWDRANSVTTFLKHFYDVSNVFAGSKYSTANMYFPEICDIHLQLIEWCQNSDDFIHSLALKMKNRFDEYWKKCSLALAIAAILDPRFKMKLLEYYYPQIYGAESPKCIDIVSNCMKALYHGHAIYSPLASHGPGDDRGSDSRDRLTGYDRFLYETSESQNIKSDLDKYLEEPLFPRNVDFNILNWWKVHTPRYPILSMMASNILGIPLSKVSLEFIYDTGNRAVDSARGSLRSDTLQALMCAQDWMRPELEDSKASLSSATLAERYDPK
ncbi:zinc finger BED domain-containing protein DAYSLEEPER-like [Ipomoea triloba]|uniref:zinc finger BED domain-containing protein DAYSLEEPER-like n=1 Tax=Ipomoea triloba TaxID=35885 RepID=UPI00125D689B|nr:zinc finger BED domain-containing protein DAYSLEEPER-like [Ipomoea triloba]XP_031091881.1 zinc finger BED domain-containing protein DAYSLEEPER-like [Ipomoea triloba]XP_031091882.1 zinc finger BED domain-containing protein DAYSLEEPER-like [Ipomoea triloba]